MTIGIYKITNLLSGHFYIGSSMRIEKRWCQHKTDLRAGRHFSSHLQRAWDKYGEVAFSLEILEECSASIRREREQFYLDLLTPWDHTIGYNNARTTSNYSPSPETLHKMSESAKKRKRTPLSSDTRNRISEAHKGRKKSEEAKANMSKARKGKPAHNRGVVYSEEVRKRMSDAAKRRKRS